MTRTISEEVVSEALRRRWSNPRFYDVMIQDIRVESFQFDAHEVLRSKLRDSCSF